MTNSGSEERALRAMWRDDADASLWLGISGIKNRLDDVGLKLIAFSRLALIMDNQVKAPGDHEGELTLKSSAEAALA